MVWCGLLARSLPEFSPSPVGESRGEGISPLPADKGSAFSPSPVGEGRGEGIRPLPADKGSAFPPLPSERAGVRASAHSLPISAQPFPLSRGRGPG